MKLFKKKREKKQDILKSILEELQEIRSIIEDEQSENQKLGWLLLSQDNEIVKLKSKNKELTKKLKERGEK